MNCLNKTFLSSSNYHTRNWIIIDCKNQKLGRLSTIITTLLKGKVKPYYHPATDIGDHVILINADSIIINKTSKHYIVTDPGRPGKSLKIKNAVDSTTKFTIEQAVKGMLSTTETKRLMKRLKIYSDQTHPHAAQKPISLDLTKYKVWF